MTTIANFTTALAVIPYAPTRPEARGIIAPLLRATGHLLFLLAHMSIPANDTHTQLTPEEQLNELTHARTHLSGGNYTDLPTVSTTAKGYYTAFIAGVETARSNWASWAADARIGALRDLTNRAAGLGTILDRELTGIDHADSDPGSTL